MLTALLAIAFAQPQPVKFEDLPPPLKLGVRADGIKRALKVSPVLIIVNDGESYLSALSRWAPDLRYPVLIDDGTPAAAENIGRFARAFSPARVLRLSADKPTIDPPNLPARADDIVRAAWALPAFAEGADGSARARALLAGWKSLQVTPPGIVVANSADPAWPAAIALAAGRAQPLVWVIAKQDLSGWTKPAEIDALATAIESAANTTGLAWRTVGDDLDAVTLCLNVAAKYSADDKEMTATTDRIGRIGVSLLPGERWAWAGQVPGTQAESAYRAMCALFLPAGAPRNAWLFDGYNEREPYTYWDATKAGEILKSAAWNAEVYDSPANSLQRWRERAARAIDADLLLINSSGNYDFFELPPDKGTPGDMPLLARPAAIHVVHSWSAQVIGRVDSIGGRLVQHGAYAYIGSVQEPFLQGFVPTPDVAARAASLGPWGAVGRYDKGPMSKPWKIAVFGDPLATLGEPAPRREPVDLPGARSLEEQMSAALKDRKLADALRALVMLGRDQDAADLGEALTADAKPLTPPLAELAAPALFRQGRADALFKLVRAIDPNPDRCVLPEGEAKDALWLTVWPRLNVLSDQDLLYTLRANVRASQPAADALELAKPWARVFGRSGAASMLEWVRDHQTSSRSIQQMEAAVKQFGR